MAQTPQDALEAGLQATGTRDRSTPAKYGNGASEKAAHLTAVAPLRTQAMLGDVQAPSLQEGVRVRVPLAPQQKLRFEVETPGNPARFYLETRALRG